MRSRIRALLLLLLLGAILLEALTWIRVPLFEAVQRAYPTVTLGRDGDVVYVDLDLEERADGTSAVIRKLDAMRTPPEVLALGPTRALDDLVALGVRARRWNLDFDYAEFLRLYAWAREPGFVPLPPLEQMAYALRSTEARRRGIDPRDAHLAALPRVPIDWRIESGRIVCRETATGQVVAGLGPDGYARGATANEGERFGNIETATSARPKPADTHEWLLLDWDAREIHVLSMRSGQAEEKSLPSDATDPVELTIEARPLHALRVDAPTEDLAFCAIVGTRVLTFLADGSVVAEVALEPGERVTSTSGALLVRADGAQDYFGNPKRGLDVFAMETRLSPTHPGDDRRRLRIFRPGQPEIVRDVVLTPTRMGEVLLANLTGAFALLRPPPLALLSAVSALPADRETWWWRDPWLADGRYAFWLVLTFALAGFLAWRARRAARERCATMREVRFWTAAVFLLGPVGLLWMRLVLPRVPVESVGGARRAVNLDVSPGTSAPWPEPKPLGIEVFS